MRVYFDSSAFAKRYVDETRTAEVLKWCEDATEIAMSVIAVPELISAFNRLLREARIDAGQYEQLKAGFLADIGDAFMLETTPLVIRNSIRVLGTHPLRGMDAIHVASALDWPADVFVSADLRQSAAAQALGLRVAAL